MTHRLQAQNEELEAKVKELEESVKKLTDENFDLENQNAELLKDVEILNLQGSSASGFDNSMVITERINSAERELIKMKGMVKSLTAERDSLREDYKAVLQSKYSGDKGHREAMEQMKELQEQLEYFQNNANIAVQERNQYQDEAEEFKMRNLQLEQDIRDAQAKSNQEKRMHVETSKSLETSKSEVKRLNVKLQEFESLPEVQEHLNLAKKEIQQLKKDLSERESKLTATVTTRDNLQKRVDDFDLVLSSKEREIERLRQQLKESDKQHGSEVSNLRSNLDENRMDKRALEEKVEELDSQLASTQVELERYRKSATEGGQTGSGLVSASDHGFVSDLERQLANERETIERTTQEKIKALMQVSSLEQQLQKIQQDFSSLSDRNAELEEEIIILRDVRKQGGGDTPDSPSPSTPSSSAPASAVEAANNVGAKKQAKELSEKMEKLNQLAATIKDLRVKLNKEAQRSWIISKRSPWGKIMQEINNLASESKNLRAQFGIESESGKKKVSNSSVSLELVETFDFGVESLKQFVQRFCT